MVVLVSIIFSIKEADEKKTQKIFIKKGIMALWGYLLSTNSSLIDDIWRAELWHWPGLIVNDTDEPRLKYDECDM